MEPPLEFTFTATDMARTRFAVSPLQEVVTSLRILRLASRSASASRTGLGRSMHRQWVEAVRPAVTAAGLDRGLLADLIPDSGYTPDFITPPPAGGAGFEGELRQLAETTESEVRRELSAYGLATARIEALYADPRAGLPRLIAEITAYWEVALAPYWPKIQAVLEADVHHQARRLAADGAEAVMGDLHPSVRWNADRLIVDRKLCKAHGAPLDGRGLVLVPSVFSWQSVQTTTAPPVTKQLFYPSRGLGLVWERERTAVPDAVAAVLGRTRALLLTELAAPASTSDLAGRTGMSAGGVSQHLTALRDAGIVSAHRAGRSVLYMRTPVADALLAAGR